MLSTSQRSRINDTIAEIAAELGITVLDERQRIENLDDFPLCQTTFLTEGRRQNLWQDLLYESQNSFSHVWTSNYGHFAQATVSVSIRSLDPDELQSKSYAFAIYLWKILSNWHMEDDAIKMEFRGGENPKFLPPYLDTVQQRHDIYTCVIDFFVDYEFSWTVEAPPITVIYTDTRAGLVDTEDYSDEISLISTAPGCYLMMASLTGLTSAYRMSVLLTKVLASYQCGALLV